MQHFNLKMQQNSVHPDLLAELTVLLKPKDLRAMSGRDKWEEGLSGGNSGPLASNPGTTLIIIINGDDGCRHEPTDKLTAHVGHIGLWL